MRIISHRTLVLFYTKHSTAKTALEEWYSKVSKAKWEGFADIKKDFNSVDCVGDQRYVFNIKGNDYRLVAIIKFKIKMTNTKITKGLKEAKYKTIIVTIIL